jgi:hypothetical protein
MKKLFLALTLLLPIALACNVSKPIEVEMQLPAPSVTPTTVIAAAPTAPATETQPTPSEPISVFGYTIEDIKGTALIIPAGSDVPESAEEGEAVEANDEILTKDYSEMTIALNDDTMFHVSDNSRIKVEEIAPNATQGFKSRIELIFGNILSEVEKLDESKSSFEIDAGGVVCAVRGTAFEVQRQGSNISASTFHGMVQMQKGRLNQDVNANEHSTFSLKKAGFLAQRRLSPAERRHYQTWVRAKTAVQKKRAKRIANHEAVQRPPIKKTQPQTAKKPRNIGRHKSTRELKSARSVKHPSGIINHQKIHARSQSLRQKQASSKPKTRHAQLKRQVKSKPAARLSRHQPKQKNIPKKHLKSGMKQN